MPPWTIVCVSGAQHITIVSMGSHLHEWYITYYHDYHGLHGEFIYISNDTPHITMVSMGSHLHDVDGTPHITIVYG